MDEEHTIEDDEIADMRAESRSAKLKQWRRLHHPDPRDPDYEEDEDEDE